MGDNNFKNLWLFDLVAMLALLFMALILLRAEETKKTTMPGILSIVNEDSTNFSIITDQINILHDRLRMLQDPYMARIFISFKEDRQIIDSMLTRHDVWVAKYDTTVDIFNRMDTLFHTRRDLGQQIKDLVMFRDSLLYRYLRETKIERKMIGEDELMFPVNEAVPFANHPFNKRPREAILADIYTIVDSYIKQGYNIVKVVGHTDPTYTAKHNRDLSLRRAQYLAEKIQAHIDSRYGSREAYIVQATGLGEFDLLPKEPGEDRHQYWQRNRRVELVFSFQRFDRRILDN